MIKWKFVVIRLSILGAVLCVIHFGSAPLLSFLLRTTVQAVTGSKLEIENLDASPFQTRMTTGPVRLGHPKKKLENLFNFDEAEIKLDQASLLRKKFIVTTGVVNGLEFGTGRDQSGHLDPVASSKPSLINNYLSNAGKNAADGFASLLTRRFEENFESMRYSKEVLDRWPEEYEKLLARGKRLEREIREIRDLAKKFADNPLNSLRDLPKVEQGVRDSIRIRKELFDIRNQLGQYRGQVIRDRDNILAAKDRDLARIREIKTDKRLNGRSLSQLLVGDSQGKRVDQTIAWIKWMRKTFPHPKKSIKANRHRGETIRFDGQVDQPDFLVRSMRLNGHGTLENKPYVFTGTLAGVTTQPEIYGKPAYLQFTSSGDIEFSVKGMIDRTGEVDHDRLTVSIPELRMAQKDLKIDEAMQIQLGRAKLQVTARVDLIGEQLTGQIKAIQTNVQLGIESDLKNSFATEIKSMLNQDLGTVNQFEVIAKLSGTVDRPRWQLHSNLGPQIATAVNSTLARGYEQKKNELIAKLNLESDKALAKVANLLKEQEGKVLAFVNEKSKDVFQLEERVSSLLKIGGLRFR